MFTERVVRIGKIGKVSYFVTHLLHSQFKSYLVIFAFKCSKVNKARSKILVLIPWVTKTHGRRSAHHSILKGWNCIEWQGREKTLWVCILKEGHSWKIPFSGDLNHRKDHYFEHAAHLCWSFYILISHNEAVFD